MKNFILVVISVIVGVGVVPCLGAPAVTSVHVSFVSGNKKTQYSHGTHTRPAVVQYRLQAAGTGIGDSTDLLARRLRSISASPSPRGRRYRGRGSKILLVAPPTKQTTLQTPEQSTTTAGTVTSSSTPRGRRRHPAPLTFSPGPTTPTRRQQRVRFVEGATSGGASSSTTTTQTLTEKHTASPSIGVQTTIPSGDRPKDSKAVKRSPYIENFEARGITFPDFDEFGGNEFGALRNFIGTGGSGGGGGGPAAAAAVAAHANPESLSPDGVFLPPLPTEASDYTEDGHGHADPYLADPETAKYAAQHPPFFAAFPHKRTVLDLNERRVEQGLEPNILRSIRPYFAFFEAANPRHYPHHEGPHHPVVVAEIHGSPHVTAPSGGGAGPAANLLGGHLSPAPQLPTSFDVYTTGGSPTTGVVDPNLLLYASLLNNQAGVDVAEAWSVFPHKKRRK